MLVVYYIRLNDRSRWVVRYPCSVHCVNCYYLNVGFEIASVIFRRAVFVICMQQYMHTVQR